MALMWHHLNNRQVVEVQVQLSRNRGNRRVGALESMFDKKLHLRPDVMLKAMPENCGIVVDPQTDQHGAVCWVFGPPHVDKKGRVSPPNNQTHKLYKRREKALAELGAVRGEIIQSIEGLVDKSTQETLLGDTNELADVPTISTGPIDWASKMGKHSRRALEEALKERARQRTLRQQLKERFQQRLPKRERE
ncbi:hypothetical protein BDZ45DRAFT_682024 [Acephala macrosclerotiorum]|nr:hypothetical protein BDZ45DRAFT_682024 [Acephala macrosclerotiorum]